MQGSRSLLFLAPLSFTLLSACLPGSSEHLSTPDSGAGDDSGTQLQLPACSLGSSMADIEAKLFRGVKCATCHVLTPSGQRPLFPTTLEFTSPNLAARMVDKPAEADPNLGKCAGRILVPKNDPLNGLFVQKVTGPPCGAQMPMAMQPLNEDNVNCVKRWAILAAQSVK